MSEEFDLNDLINEMGNMESESGLDHVTTEDENNGDINTVGEGYEVISFGLPSIADPKEVKTFIRKCEAMIRSSNEYTKYMSYLKGMLNINKCSIFGNINSELASIEMHHYPFTLYEICEHTLENFFSKNIPVTTFSVSDEVLRLHYDNLVGLVPLSKTAHELAHSGQITIDLVQVFGNVKDYMLEYKDFIDQESIDKIKAIEEYTITKPLINENPAFLNVLDTTTNDTPAFSSADVNNLTVIVAAEIPISDRRLARFKK